jgi:hypothetical protein
MERNRVAVEGVRAASLRVAEPDCFRLSFEAAGATTAARTRRARMRGRIEKIGAAIGEETLCSDRSGSGCSRRRCSPA